MALSEKKVEEPKAPELTQAEKDEAVRTAAKAAAADKREGKTAL